MFTRSGQTWTQQGGKLEGTGEVGKTINFGARVALSADGDTALISGPSDDDEAGAVWVFTRSGETWTQQGQKLTGRPVEESSFGESVALSENGNTALIGGYYDGAELFTRSGETWTQHGEYLASTDERLEPYRQRHVGRCPHGPARAGGARIRRRRTRECPALEHEGREDRRRAKCERVRHRLAHAPPRERPVDHLRNKGQGRSVEPHRRRPGTRATGGAGQGSGPPAPRIPRLSRHRRGLRGKEKVAVEPETFWETRLLGGTPIREKSRCGTRRHVREEQGRDAGRHVLTGTLTPEVGEDALLFGPGSGELAESASGHATITGTMKVKGKKAPDLSVSAP